MNKKHIFLGALLILVLVLLAFVPVVIKKDSTINLVILVFLYITLASSWNILGDTLAKPTWAMPLSLAWAAW